MNYYAAALKRLRGLDLESELPDEIEDWFKDKREWLSEVEARAAKERSKMPKVLSEERLKEDIERAIQLLESGEIESGIASLLEIAAKPLSQVQRYERPRIDGLIDYEAVRVAGYRPRNVRII